MNADILWLNEIKATDVPIAGGKGANLGELAGKGFPVPPGFVVSALACEKFFGAIKLENELKILKDTSPDDLKKVCFNLQGIIEKAELPEDLLQSILSHHQELVKQRGAEIVCAVRSSATAEDTCDASFAGQHGTYYYVDDKHLLRMIKHCWASMLSPEAVIYRETQGIEHSSVFMAVVVQEMILSQVSGITFTANPVTGDKNEIVIESSWGMGAAIVDGRVTPDHYLVERNGLKLHQKRIADKKFLVPSKLKVGSKERLEKVPHDMRHKETLHKDLVRKVAEWAVKSEEHFGNPQDVEWAITDGEYYMLQSRPITVMGQQEFARDEEGKYVLFKPIVENFTDPFTPLSIDLMTSIGPPGIKFIGGRAYSDVNVYRHLFPFKLSEQDMVNFMYLSGDEEAPELKIDWVKFPFFVLIVFILYFALGPIFIRTRRMPDDFMDCYRGLCDKIDADPKFRPFEALARLWPKTKFFDPIGNMVMWVNFSSLRYAMWMGLLKKFLRARVTDLKDDAEDLLCSGTTGVLSTEMGRGVWELAKEARGHAKVREILVEQKPDKILDELRAAPEAGEFLAMFDKYITKNGHRGLKELEFRSVRWGENPAQVLGMVRNYMLVESDPGEHERKVEESREELKSKIKSKLDEFPMEKSLGIRWRIVNLLLGKAKYFAKIRENSRFYHVMALYVVRKKIVRMEKELMEQGKLKCKDDVFYLRYPELIDLMEGRLGWLDVEDRIRDRRMEHVRLSKIMPPKTINIEMPKKVEENVEDPGDGSLLKGQSASPGQYEGIAHVILDPAADIELKPGEILVAPYTDPAWTPLFLTAGAAVVEIGSYLSHAGTIAREYGMPCVVDVPDGTKRIHSGDRILVDGEHGTVKFLSKIHHEGEAQ